MPEAAAARAWAERATVSAALYSEVITSAYWYAASVSRATTSSTASRTTPGRSCRVRVGAVRMTLFPSARRCRGHRLGVARVDRHHFRVVLHAARVAGQADVQVDPDRPRRADRRGAVVAEHGAVPGVHPVGAGEVLERQAGHLGGDQVAGGRRDR